MKPPRVNVLGVGISAVTMAQTVAQIEEWIVRREQHYVCVTGVHGVMESQKDPALKRIHNASGLTVPDGMPMVWLCHWAGYKHVERVYGPDLMLALCESSVTKGYRHFLYGGAEGVPQQLASVLRQRFQGIQITGSYSPSFRPLTDAEDEQIVQTINDANPDIIWVGLSTPKQERWMSTHVGCVRATVMIGVGAAFDFHAGRVKQAPRWMQRGGLEWLFRLTQDPKRLWRRYLCNNPLFVWNVALQLLGLKNYPME